MAKKKIVPLSPAFPSLDVTIDAEAHNKAEAHVINTLKDLVCLAIANTRDLGYQGRSNVDAKDTNTYFWEKMVRNEGLEKAILFFTSYSETVIGKYLPSDKQIRMWIAMATVYYYRDILLFGADDIRSLTRELIKGVCSIEWFRAKYYPYKKYVNDSLVNFQQKVVKENE